MKRIIFTILILMLVSAVFTGCSLFDNDPKDEAKETVTVEIPDKDVSEADFCGIYYGENNVIMTVSAGGFGSLAVGGTLYKATWTLTDGEFRMWDDEGHIFYGYVVTPNVELYGVWQYTDLMYFTADI